MTTRTYDCIVVGAGVFGLASAWHLGRAGLRVLVVDRGVPGGEASGFALGRIDPVIGGVGSKHTSGEAEHSDPLGKPEDQAEFGLLGYRRHLAQRAEIEGISRIDYEFDDRPTVQLFFDDAARNFGEQIAPEWTRRGFPTAVIEQNEVAKIDRRIAAPERGGAVVQGPFFINSLKFTQALAVCAAAERVELLQEEVNGLSAASSGVTASTANGDYHAASALIAAGPWTAQVAGLLGAKVPVTPSKGEILRVIPPPGPPLPVHVHGPCSLMHKRDGFLWIAATAADEGFDDSPTEWARRRLLANGRSMMPDVARSPLFAHTVCFRPATPDGIPVAGRLGSNLPVWAASGGGGSGIMQCLAIGETVARMIAGNQDDPDIPALRLSRFD